MKLGLSKDSWLVTGGTGHVGQEVLRQLSQRKNDIIYVLIRRKRGVRPQDRLLDILSQLEIDYSSDRFIAIEGNIEQPQFNLNEDTWSELTNKVNYIIHCAASTQFTASIKKAAIPNVEGVKNILEFAKACHTNEALKKMTHLSTAYVLGSHQGIVNQDTPFPDHFRNTYEETKAMGERVLEEYQDRYNRETLINLNMDGLFLNSLVTYLDL